MKVLAIVRYPHRGSAKAVKSALNLYFHNRASAACVFALSIVIWLIPRAAIASEGLDQKFDGVVVPCQWVQVVPHINDVVSRILFEPGQHVSKGDVLFEMEADDFALDVRMAQSELDEARAHLTLAEDAATRQAQLLRQNATIRQLARCQEPLGGHLSPLALGPYKAWSWWKSQSSIQ
jgi:multidrug efflux pump subunit AcrA (membrane-fusion protein)